MLLTKQQHFVFDWLREYGGLKIEHIVALLKMKYDNETLHLEPILRQLTEKQMVKKEGNLYLASGKTADLPLLNALDIMLMLSTKDIQTARRGHEPFLLTFFKQKNEKLYRYDVLTVSRGDEPVVCAQLEGIKHKYRVVILMLDSLDQQELIQIGCDHIFAVTENGGPKFYRKGDIQSGVQ